MLKTNRSAITVFFSENMRYYIYFISSSLGASIFVVVGDLFFLSVLLDLLYFYNINKVTIGLVMDLTILMFLYRYVHIFIMMMMIAVVITTTIMINQFVSVGWIFGSNIDGRKSETERGQ